MPDIDARRAAGAVLTSAPLDEGVGLFIDALARALARRDHLIATGQLDESDECRAPDQRVRAKRSLNGGIEDAY